jgi:hypothetical protein
MRRSETIYLVCDKFGGDETDDLWPGANRNAATQKRTAAAIRYRGDMVGKYARPKRRSLLTMKNCFFLWYNPPLPMRVYGKRRAAPRLGVVSGLGAAPLCPAA